MDLNIVVVQPAHLDFDLRVGHEIVFQPHLRLFTQDDPGHVIGLQAPDCALVVVPVVKKHSDFSRFTASVVGEEGPVTRREVDKPFAYMERFKLRKVGKRFF